MSQIKIQIKIQIKSQFLFGSRPKKKYDFWFFGMLEIGTISNGKEQLPLKVKKRLIFFFSVELVSPC
jgi:hypothetical protein